MGVGDVPLHNPERRGKDAMTETDFAAGSAISPSLRWKDDGLYLLDQSRLPQEFVVERQESVEQVWESISRLKVRGAPAIGIAGAYGLLVGLRSLVGLDLASFLSRAESMAAFLESSRPTAVNLGWALRRMSPSPRSMPPPRPARRNSSASSSARPGASTPRTRRSAAESAKAAKA